METARFLIANATLAGISTYSLEDLMARKLHALFERKEGKDIYDIALVIDKIEKRKLLSSLKEVLRSEKKKISSKKFIEKLISDLKNVDCKKIRNITNPYIPLANRPKEWKILIDTLIDNLEKLVR
jgi:predicted nucleotidyltransferase component of viral defense system